jgi:filamentous hemagglutinin
VLLEAVQDVYSREETREDSGFFADAFAGRGGFGITVGTKTEEHAWSTATRTSVTSALSAGGGILIGADRDIHGDAPTITAGGDIVAVAGRDLVLATAQDLMRTSESHEVSQMGVTLALREHVSEAVSRLGGSLETMGSGKGSGLNKAVSALSGGLEAVSAARGLATGSLVSLEASLGFSSSKSSASSTAEVNHGGMLTSGGSISLEAGRDLRLEGTTVQALEDLTLKAGRDLLIRSAESYFTSDWENSRGSLALTGSLGLGFGGFTTGVSGSVQASRGNGSSWSHTHDNADLVAGGSIRLTSGRDTEIRGGNVVAGEGLTVDVGRNLTIASVQNEGGSTGSSGGFSLGGGTSWTEGVRSTTVSGSLSGGGSDRYRLFTDDQTELVAGGDVRIKVGGHTQLDGAVIASLGGNLSLETETFGWSDLTDIDRGESAEGSFGTPGLPVGGDGPKGLDWVPTLEGYSASELTEGLSRATISAAHGLTTITIHADPTRGLEGLNRDLELAQEILNQEESAVRVYVDGNALRGILEGAEDLDEAIEALVAALTPAAPEAALDLRRRDTVAKELAARMAAATGRSEAEIRQELLWESPTLLDAMVAEGNLAVLKRMGVKDADLANAAVRMLTGDVLKVDGQGRPILTNGVPSYEVRTNGSIGLEFDNGWEFDGSRSDPWGDETALKRLAPTATVIMAEAHDLLEKYGTTFDWVMTGVSFAAAALTTGPAAGAVLVAKEKAGDLAAEQIIGVAYEGILTTLADGLQGLDKTLTRGEAENLANLGIFSMALTLGGAKPAKDFLKGGKGERPTLTQHGNAVDDIIPPGLDRPFRTGNLDFPPIGSVVDKMNSDTFAEFIKIETVDCSEIANKLFNSANGVGEIIEVRPKNSGTLTVFENGDIQDGYYYHQVYTDGRYIYDPRLSTNPIPKGDWERHIKSMNPDGITIYNKHKG